MEFDRMRPFNGKHPDDINEFSGKSPITGVSEDPIDSPEKPSKIDLEPSLEKKGPTLLPYINISSLLNKLTPTPFIENVTVEQSIDRICIAMKNKKGLFRLIKNLFKVEFKYQGCKKRKAQGTLIYNYSYDNVNIRLIKYRNKPYWFEISVSDPSKDVQLIIKKVLENLECLKCEVSLHQIEFALDLYPFYRNSLYLLQESISHHLVLNHSRIDSFRQIGETIYQGRKGNVRNGSKGLRCYPKEEHSSCFLRVELQANRKMIRRVGIDLNTLPIDPSHIDLFDYVSMRRGLDKDSLDKMCVAFRKKRLKMKSITLPPMSCRILEQGYKSRILSDLGENPLFDKIEAPVAVQISVFKVWKKKLGVSSQVDRFFPPVRQDGLPPV